MRTLALCCLCLLPAWAPAQGPAPAVKLPAEVRARPAEIAELKAETAGKQVKWVVLTPGLSVRPVDGGKTLLFSGPPGRYELLAYTAAGDVPSDPARCAVGIDGAPNPPAPDPLKARLARAAAADRAAGADLLQLAAIYREAAKVAADRETPDSAALLARVRKVSADLLGPDALPSVRAAAAEELLAALGMTSDEPFTDARRARAAEAFLKLAEALEELAK